MMYISSVMLLLYITMKINSSGKERSHKLLQANVTYLYFLWYSLMMYIKSIIIVLYISWIILLFVFLFLLLPRFIFRFLSVFCSFNVSIDEGMFGLSIGASKIGLGEFTESNGHVCDDTISGLGGSGLVVVKCLQNMALLIMTKLYNGL